MTFARAERPASLTNIIANQLAQFVRAGQRADGEWLPTERELSAQLGVSRSVVREATKRLESQGLIEVCHGLGIKVINKPHRPLSESLTLLIPDEEQRLRQLNETRLAIEPKSAELAAMNATDAQVTALQQLHQQLVEAPDNLRAIEVDMAFHRALAEASRNQIFCLILDSLAEIGYASRQRTIGRIGKEPAISQHAAVLAAIQRRNPKAAAEAMRYHIIQAGADMKLREPRRRAANR